MTVILTVMFWTYMFCVQAVSVWRYFTIEIEHPVVRDFAYSYAFTSSAHLFLFIACAALLTSVVWIWRSAWSAAGLSLLFGVAIWRYFFAGISVFFRPPLSDGTLSNAFSAYLNVNRNFLVLRICEALLLPALLVLWAICFRRLSALNAPNERLPVSA